MSIALNRYAVGDDTYVDKFNGDAGVLEGAINALQAATKAEAGSVTNLSNTQTALFGDVTAILGLGAYLPTTSGDTLNIAPGDAWFPNQLIIVGKNTSTGISFTGFGANTYYVHVDTIGEPTVNTTSTTALYSVVWDGANFGAITLLVPVVFSGASWEAALSSATLNIDYTDLDSRIEGAEQATIARHAQSMAAGNVTLTDDQAMHAATIRLTGVQTADSTLTFPTRNKPYIIINDCSGGFAVNLSGGGGANVATADGGRYLVAVQDTNVTLIAILSSDATPHVISAQYNDTLLADYEILAYIFTLNVSYAVNFAGSFAKSRIAATAQTDFDIQKNGASIGTLRFAASATVGSFIVAAIETFAPDDDLDFIAPTTPDVTLSGVRISVKGTKV